MSFALGMSNLEHGQRPGLFRSRSHTIPSDQKPSSDPPSAVSTTPIKSKRPSHFRSISYVSTNEPKSRTSTEQSRLAPAEKDREKHHRIHLPGSNRHRDNDRDDPSRRKHRHTQSDLHTYSRPKNKSRDDSTFPNLVAGLNSEKFKRAYGLANSHHGTNPNYNTTDSTSGNLTRVRTSHSHRLPHSRGNSSSHIVPFNPTGDAVFGGFYHGDSYGRAIDEIAARRRGTSDPKHLNTAQSADAHPRTQIELDLERADRLRQRKRTHVTPADLAKKDKEINAAEDELRDRVASINRSAMEITRRLDYGYYALLEQVGNLVGTIQSFQTLSTQSKQMLENFDSETTRLDEEIRSRISAFRIGWDGREERVNGLEERGKEASRKAEELRRRLENVRVIVTNWENRETKSRRTWGWVWSGVGITMGLLLIILIFAAIWREWWFRGDPVKAGLSVPGTGSNNRSWALGDGGIGDKRLHSIKDQLPVDVRKVLEGIERRNRRGKGYYGTNAHAEVVCDGEEIGTGTNGVNENTQKRLEEVEKQRVSDDERLRILDEL